MLGHTFFSLFFDSQARKFVLGVLVGLSFSIGVILCTIGLMDGFVYSLKEGLKNATGEISITSDNGFFKINKVKPIFDYLKVDRVSYSILSEGFIVSDDQSKGVSIVGINDQDFNAITGMNVKLETGAIVLGESLAKSLNAKKGNEVVIALANGNKESADLPQLHSFPVVGTVTHNVYEKDSRIIYIKLTELQEILNSQEKVNSISLNIPASFKMDNGDEFSDRQTAIEEYSLLLEGELGIEYRVKPYWYDFHYLLKAVDIEKNTISLILQVIVLISIFNVIAFVKFLNERKAREFFLYRALGMSQKKINKLWMLFIAFIWTTSCLASLVFVELFKWALNNVSYLELPADVYYLSSLELLIQPEQVALVFGLALVWLVMAYGISIWRIKKKSLLHGLRKEFS